VIIPYNKEDPSFTYPYLVVNIGSGVSILKVTSPTAFERVSGSSIGGGTYWGLCRLLTKCDKYEDVLGKLLVFTYYCLLLLHNSIQFFFKV
jgi:type II pantothenate kinase